MIPALIPSITPVVVARRLTAYVGLGLALATLGGMVAWSWGRLVEIQIDFGREFYLSWQLAEGKRFYPDLVYYYGPLSPYFNALVFALFGVSLRTLTVANLIVASLITVVLYVLLRGLAGAFAATIACLAFVLVFACASYAPPNSFNYVCPYSHTATHALLIGLVNLLLAGRVNRAPTLRNTFLCGLAASSTTHEVPTLWESAGRSPPPEKSPNTTIANTLDRISPRRTPILVISSCSRLRPSCTVLAFLSISAVSLVLSQRGWKNTFIGPDSLIGIGQARVLLRSGHLPQKACLSSFGTYIPPGSAWLLVPGVATGVPELYERPGACLLFLISLVGVFVLSRQSFGHLASLGATAFFAFSDLGIYWATSLWPRGHAAFYVWMAALTIMWIRSSRGWILASIVVTFALGMYVHMELAFAIIAVGLCWVVYRPPIRIAPLAVGMVIGFVFWLPYLTFEASRHFIDLRSQLFRYDNYGEGLTDGAADRMEQYESTSGTFGPIPIPSVAASRVELGTLHFVAGHASLHVWTFGLQICRNFIRERPSCYVELPLLAWLLLVVVGTKPAFLCWLTRRRWLRGVGMLFVAAGILLNPWTLTTIFRVSEANQDAAFRRLCLIEVLVIGAGTCFIYHQTLSKTLNAFAWFSRGAIDELRGKLEFRVTMLFLAVPWFLLALLAREPYRIWGLWPLQVVILTGSVVLLAKALEEYCPCAKYAVGTAALALVAVSPGPWARAHEWVREGFGGRSPDIVRALRCVAGHVGREGGVPTRIGYHLLFMGYECNFNEIDPAYRIGAMCDDYLASQYGIQNQTVRAEGFSGDDDIKLLEIVPPDPEHFTRFRFTGKDRFRRVATFDSVEVWLRHERIRPNSP
jgi:hypothetical protein